MRIASSPVVRTGCLIAALLSLIARGGLAQPTQKLDSHSTVATITPKADDDFGYWSRGDTRWFVSTRSEVGTPYAKPYVSAGYGKPHWLWAGADLNAIVTPEFAQGYAGLRASSPLLDLAIGVRDTASFSKGFLPPARSYTHFSVFDPAAPRARYWAWEAEAVAILPLPHSALVGDFVAVRTLDVPAGSYVYDESYRAVVKNALFGVVRGVAVARLLRDDALKFGVLAELVFATGRERPVVRLGPVVALQITDHLEGVGALSLAVQSPDALGLTLGAYGVCGLRYRWATGESEPRLPWRGNMIP